MNEDYKYSNTNLLTLKSHLLLTPKLETLFNKLIKKCCKEMVFSRFPYYDGTSLSDKKLALTRKEGNCVAFAYYMKHLLNLNNINAFIIGGKPPPKFARQGYREISHAAVIVPHTTGFCLFDTSFYFDKVINLDENKNYKDCKSFTNVYSKQTDKWCFTLNDDRINVSINDSFVNAYYQVRELKNPSQSITPHTNRADRVVFRCEVDASLIYKLYYKINMYNNMLTVSGANQNESQISVHELMYTNNKPNTIKLKAWIDMLNINQRQKRTMYKDVYTFLSNNYPFVL